MKKILTGIFALTLVLALAACGESDTDGGAFDSANGSQSETEHRHSYTDEVIAPTCQEQGYTAHICDCGDSYRDTETEIVDHSYDETGICIFCAKKISIGMSFEASEDGTYCVLQSMGSCSDSDVVIPETYNGLPVRTIGKEAFKHNQYITSVTIPEGVIEIEDEAFNSCSNLSSVSIPSTVQNVGWSAFGSNELLTQVSYGGDVASWCAISFDAYGTPLYHCDTFYINGELITDLIIPEGVTEIGTWVFCDYNALTSVSLPSTLTAIGTGAFHGCSNLTEIIIPEGVTEIGTWAFYNCTALTEVVLPEGLLTIGDVAFNGCKSMTEIILPEGLTAIGSDAFNGCVGLTKIVIPNSISGIESGTFQYCDALTEVTVGNGVTYIGSGAFYDCVGLTEIVLPEGVTSIDQFAFYGCKNITDIYLPSTLNIIGQSAFSLCEGLKKIHFGGTEDQWGSINKESNWDFVTGDYTINCKD